MSDLTIFQYLNMQLRVINQQGEPWFVAADVCAALELSNPTKALLRLDADEQALISIQGLNKGNDSINIINESGLYNLVLGSRKPEAKKFKKWVTAEVLPAIRKTGFYVDPDLNQPDRDNKLVHELHAELHAALKETVQLQRQLLSIKEAEIAKRTRKKQRSSSPLTEAEITRIRELKRAGMSGRQIAKKLNRSQATISWVSRNVIPRNRLPGTLDLFLTPSATIPQ